MPFDTHWVSCVYIMHENSKNFSEKTIEQLGTDEEQEIKNRQIYLSMLALG